MDLEQVRKTIVLIAGEDGTKAFLGPGPFTTALQLASLKQFKIKLGLPEEYKPGMPYPAQAFEITQRITEDMKRFKVVKGWHLSAPLVVGDNGIVAYPSDYYIASAASVFAQFDDLMERELSILSDLEYQKRRTTVHLKPDFVFPICKMIAEGIMVDPKEISHIHLTYLRLPTSPVYAFNTSKGYNEYDPVNSVELDWDDMNVMDIISLVLADIGIKISNENILQYANKVTQGGV